MFVLVSSSCQKLSSFHYEYSLSRYPDQNWVHFDRSAQEATTHCKKSTVAFGDCFATTFFCFFFTFQLKRNFTLSHSEKFGFAFAKFTSTSRLFSSSLYIVQKVTFVKPSLFAEPPPLLPHVGWFSPGLLFYLHLLVCFFFLRFFKLIFFVFSHFVDVVSVNFLRECMCVCKCVCECYLSH